MSERSEIVVIGGGPAGLSCSHHLTQRQRDHVVLEQAEVAETWRTQRWDGFRLNTPNFFLNLPGDPYDGADPEGFLTRSETVAHLEGYAIRSRAPLRPGVRVLKLLRRAGRFVLHTSDGTIEAANVVVATGAFQRPSPSPADARVSPGILQLHASGYRRPDQLPPGAVLIVGGGQSGCQIANELRADGRAVFLSLGRCPSVPLLYRGRQFARWAIELGIMDDTVASLPSLDARLLCNPVVGSAGGGHLCDPPRLAREGVVLVGRIEGVDGMTAHIRPDANERLVEAARFAAGFKQRVGAFVRENGIDVPEDDGEELAVPVASDVRELDLGAANVSSIVWANGYRPDFSWLRVPVFDGGGWPVHTRGVTAVRGLCFVGLPWLYKRKSALLLGVGEDADHVVSAIAGDQSHAGRIE
jgi:putative flavoprotein involved in K+ transport